jgi:zinc transport system ATP-binding protein
LLNPGSGKVSIYGESPVSARKLVGYVPQFITFDNQFPVRVREVVLMGRLGMRSGTLRYNNEDRKTAEAAMRDTEIWDLRDKILGTLSGGQRQRVLIARALVKKPRLLLLDEPTTSVDSRVEQDIYELLRQLNKEITIVLVTHDVGVISSYVNRVACINQRLVSHPIEEIASEDISKLYGSPIQMIQHKCDI